MFPTMMLFNPFQKGFVRAHTRKGKTIGPYFTKRQKKIGTVKHTKKTRVDYSEKDAQLKIKLLHEKKKTHELHVEAAKELKEKVESHKSKGNSTFKIGDKDHDISKVTKDLNNHIDHHSNEVKSHDNHISKIKDRYKTDREFFARKKPVIKKEFPKVEVKNDKNVLTPENVTKDSLIAAGGKLWEKGKMERIYFSVPVLAKILNLSEGEELFLKRKKQQKVSTYYDLYNNTFYSAEGQTIRNAIRAIFPDEVVKKI